nr:hypothetical protein [Tanacetum cinerariifolium]
MACSLPHTDSEVEALVQKLIDEDMGRQNAILNLALQFENSCTSKDNLRNAYEKCTDISQESRALIDTFLKEEELHQLHLDEEALRETLEEQAMDEKAREEKIRQKQADDDEFFLEFGVMRIDSDYDLDIDDYDLHLTHVLRSSSSARVEPSFSTSNPVRIIPGPAGLVQQAKQLKKRCELYLDELTLGAAGVITVMICRSWDVQTLTGRYVSTDFVMSDAKSNKEEYHIFRDHTYTIEPDGATSVRKAYVKSDGFVRYPFQLIPLGSIKLTDNKYLIDVAGYVTNVGRINHQKSGSRTPDFSLANGMFIFSFQIPWLRGKTNKVGLFPMVLTSMNVKLYSNKLYLSSGSSTYILDDPQIPAMHALLSENRLLSMPTTLRLRKERWKTYSFRLGTERMTVKIDDIRSRKGWNFPGYDGEKYVYDKTASTIVVMFDEPGKELLKCSADSLAAADDESGFGYADHAGLPLALANIIEEVLDVDSESSNMNTSADVNITKVNYRVIVLREELEDSDDEVAGDMDVGGADGKESSLADKIKKNRYIVDDCDSA